MFEIKLIVCSYNCDYKLPATIWCKNSFNVAQEGASFEFQRSDRQQSDETDSPIMSTPVGTHSKLEFPTNSKCFQMFRTHSDSIGFRAVRSGSDAGLDTAVSES